MKRSELKRKPPLKRTTPEKEWSRARRAALKPGRGFAAFKEQRDKVRGMACVCCGSMQDEFTAVDPAHVCSRGMGGCDDPLCVIPLCRRADGSGCHRVFDAGALYLLPSLEPQYRAEVAHAVMHLGLEGTRRRLAPSLYARDEGRAA